MESILRQLGLEDLKNKFAAEKVCDIRGYKALASYPCMSCYRACYHHDAGLRGLRAKCCRSAHQC